MAQWVDALSAKPDNLNPSFRTHMEEGDNQPPKLFIALYLSHTHNELISEIVKT